MFMGADFWQRPRVIEVDVAVEPKATLPLRA